VSFTEAQILVEEPELHGPIMQLAATISAERGSSPDHSKKSLILLQIQYKLSP
jgi:hypothetical protein